MSRYPSTTSTNDLDKEPNQQTNSSQPASNQGEARTKESRCLPSHGKTSHHPPAGSTSTAWVEKVARKQEFELLVNPSDLLAPPCFSFCIPTSRDSPPLPASSRSCLQEARDPISKFLPPTGSGLGKLWVCLRRKGKTRQQQRHMTRQLSGRVRHH